MAVPGRGAVGQGAPAPWWGAGVSGTARVTHIATGLPKGCVSDRWVAGQFCRHIDQGKHLFVLGLHYGVVCFAPVRGKRMNYSSCLARLGSIFSHFKW